VFGAVIGVVGLLLTEGAYRMARRPGWGWLSMLHEEAMAGGSLRRAHAVLEEIRRFEDNGAPPAS
jgi:hypothetical protein